MGTCSYIPIVEAAVDVVVVEIEAIVVAMSITHKIGGTGGTLRVTQKAIQKGYNHKFWFDDK